MARAGKPKGKARSNAITVVIAGLILVGPSTKGGGYDQPYRADAGCRAAVRYTVSRAHQVPVVWVGKSFEYPLTNRDSDNAEDIDELNLVIQGQLIVGGVVNSGVASAQA